MTSYSSIYSSSLKIGDIILKVDGALVNSRTDILKVIGEGLHRTGDNIKLTIWRNNEIMNLQLVLAEKN